jgi:hypothetical protein
MLYSENLQFLTNVPLARTHLGLATVAATGAYNDLTGKPALAPVATSGAYADLTGKPVLATVATTGSYTDLINTPGAPAQRAVNTATITVVAGDEIINCDSTTAAMTCVLPTAASRAGKPITFKDAKGHFGTNSLTVTCAGAEAADGIPSLLLNVNFQRLVLRPYNDGVNTGWSIDQ